MGWKQIPTYARILIGAVCGAIAVAGIGYVIVQMLQGGDGFGDLAAAAVITVFGIPLGVILGGTLGWWLGRSRQPDEGSANVTFTSV